MKTCRACGEEKPSSEYHRDGGSKDGLRPRCKSCVKAYDDTRQEERNAQARQKYAEDPQAKIAKTRQYHLDNPEWSRERLRAHHEANKAERYERYVERGKDPETQAKRREATRRSESRRRAQKRETATEFISRAELEIRLAEFDGRCYICDVELGADLHWDHYQPLAHGGAHTLGNLWPACGPCNIRKNSHWPITDELIRRICDEVTALRESMSAGSEVTYDGS